MKLAPALRAIREAMPAVDEGARLITELQAAKERQLPLRVVQQLSRRGAPDGSVPAIGKPDPDGVWRLPTALLDAVCTSPRRWQAAVNVAVERAQADLARIAARRAVRASL